MEKEKPSKAVVVGGGYAGIEMAEAFIERSIEVTLIDMAPQLMATLDKDMADLILAYMTEQQVEVFLEEKLVKIEMKISRTGLSETEAKDLKMDYQAETITSVSPAGYYPGAEKITVKLVVDLQSKRIVGGQIVGFKGAAKRIDTLATAITAGLTAQQLVDLDLSYAPPFSTVWDPVQMAARRFV